MTQNSSQIKIDDCAICFDTISEQQRVKVLQPCNHYFHNDCINQWLIIEKRCPMCMRYLHIPDEEAEDVQVLEQDGFEGRMEEHNENLNEDYRDYQQDQISQR